MSSRSAVPRIAHTAGAARDVAAGPERVGVIAAQHPLLVRQQLGEQPQRLPRIARAAGPIRDPASQTQDGSIVLVESIAKPRGPLSPAIQVLPRAVRLAAEKGSECSLRVVESPKVFRLA